MNKLCEGCSSQTGNAEECILQPEYQDSICPCVECLVKCICTQSYRECKKYKEFCDKQLPNQTQPNTELPCRGCINYDRCKDIVDEMANDLLISLRLDSGYVILEETIVDENVDSFFVDIISYLQKSCPKLESYFEFNVVSRDDMILPYGYRHQAISKDEWDERENALFEIYDCYNVISNAIPKMTYTANAISQNNKKIR
jgi:hypothetical protein